MSKSRTVITVFCFAGLIVALTGGVCFGGRSGDGEYWQTIGVGVDINKDWMFTAAQEMRLGRHNGNPYLHNVDLGIVYKGLGDWLDIGLHFKKEYEKDSKGKFRHENRPHLNLTFKGKMFGLSTSHRVRLEYRDFEIKKEVFRLRNKTTVKLPFKFTKLGLQPYVAEEFFVNLGDNNVNQNRLYSGFSWSLSKNLKASVYYMWKTSKTTGGWRDTNVVGTAFKFVF